VTNCRWQTVPDDWPGHKESSVTKFRPRTWNRVVGAGRRVEPIACWIQKLAPNRTQLCLKQVSINQSQCLSSRATSTLNS